MVSGDGFKTILISYYHHKMLTYILFSSLRFTDQALFSVQIKTDL
jgi:hypothetical protein